MVRLTTRCNKGCPFGTTFPCYSIGSFELVESNGSWFRLISVCFCLKSRLTVAFQHSQTAWFQVRTPVGFSLGVSKDYFHRLKLPLDWSYSGVSKDYFWVDRLFIREPAPCYHCCFRCACCILVGWFFAEGSGAFIWSFEFGWWKWTSSSDR